MCRGYRKAVTLVKWTDAARKEWEVRLPCPKCGASKHIQGYDNPFWLEKNIGKAETQCDNPKCRGFIAIKISKEGVEIL